MIPAPRNDINKYRGFSDFLNVIDEYPDPEAKALVDKGKSETLLDDENLRSLIVFDKAASMYYGQGTRWCTAAHKNNMFEQYAESAPIIIVIPKKPEHGGEKYQLWFNYSCYEEPIRSREDYQEMTHGMDQDELDEAIHEGQFMNERDEPIRLNSLDNRFNGSIARLLGAFLARYPDEKYAVSKNLRSNI
jgi:hypothetical protein